MVNEDVKVIPLGGGFKASGIIKSMIEAVDGVALVQSNIFEFRSYHEHMKTFSLKPEVERGAYRQFIKRDKRKNLKVNK